MAIIIGFVVSANPVHPANWPPYPRTPEEIQAAISIHFSGGALRTLECQ